VDGNFRVVFSIDDTLYTSNKYLTELKASKNPYINMDNIPIVRFSSEQLINSADFKNRERYAEVTIDSSLTTEEDLRNHIAWLLDADRKELRKVPEDYGQYRVNISTYDVETDTGLGFEYSDSVQTPIEDGGTSAEPPTIIPAGETPETSNEGGIVSNDPVQFTPPDVPRVDIPTKFVKGGSTFDITPLPISIVGGSPISGEGEQGMPIIGLSDRQPIQIGGNPGRPRRRLLKRER
jgi:hypothetical protein